MSNEKECAQYFRNQNAYHRCFQELWKKWRSYGRIFWEKLRTHQSEMDEGCHHCKKIRLSADHKRIREKSGAGEKACAKCRTGTVWNHTTVGADPDGIRKLENIHHPQLKLTAEAVKKRKRQDIRKISCRSYYMISLAKRNEKVPFLNGKMTSAKSKTDK